MTACNATVTHIQRRAFDITTHIAAVRCPCGWRTEVRNSHLADTLARQHNEGIK